MTNPASVQLGRENGEGANLYIKIGPELNRRLGGANAAYMFALIEFRCRMAGRDKHEDPTGRWWTASAEMLQADTGFSRSQIRSTIAKLEKDGYIERKKLRTKGVSDQTQSYRPTLSPAIGEIPHIDLRDSTNGSSDVGQNSPIDLRDLTNHHLRDFANVPSPSMNGKEVGGSELDPLDELNERALGLSGEERERCTELLAKGLSVEEIFHRHVMKPRNTQPNRTTRSA